MKIKRNYITPYTAFLFLVVGSSGILRFFHLFNEYTLIVHEAASLLFVIFSVLHIVTNWRSLKSRFKQKSFITAAVIVLSLATILVAGGKDHVKYEDAVLQRLYKAPISSAFNALNIEYKEADTILKRHNIISENRNTLEDVGRRNSKTPREILELFVE